MVKEVIRGNELRREIWRFLFSDRPAIYFDSYSIQTKDSTRRRTWKIEGHYSRLMQRDSTIKQPPLPLDVANEAREYFANEIKSMGITW